MRQCSTQLELRVELLATEVGAKLSALTSDLQHYRAQ